MKYTFLLLTFLLGASVAFAQGTPAPAPPANDKLAGKYEGTVKSPDQRVSLELKSEGRNIFGRLKNGEIVLETTEGSLKNGALSLSFGKEASLIAKVEGDKIVGDWRQGTQKRAIELKRIDAPAAAAAPAADAKPAAAPVNLNGEWEGVADANGQPFPFLLTLKVEGETVTGSSSSQLGEATIKSGSWKDGKLVIELEGQSGAISMSAAVVDGKLSGDFDYAGQLQGKWVAVKKN